MCDVQPSTSLQVCDRVTRNASVVHDPGVHVWKTMLLTGAARTVNANPKQSLMHATKDAGCNSLEPVRRE